MVYLVNESASLANWMSRVQLSTVLWSVNFRQEVVLGHIEASCSLTPSDFSFLAVDTDPQTLYTHVHTTSTAASTGQWDSLCRLQYWRHRSENYLDSSSRFTKVINLDFIDHIDHINSRRGADVCVCQQPKTLAATLQVSALVETQTLHYRVIVIVVGSHAHFTSHLETCVLAVILHLWLLCVSLWSLGASLRSFFLKLLSWSTLFSLCSLWRTRST